MNKTFIILLSVLLSLEFIEARPRYGYGSWRKFVRSSEESSEDDSFESCVDCGITNIGNGYKNRNIVHYNSYPDSKISQEQTDMDQEVEQQSNNERHLVSGSGYRTTLKPTYNNFGRNEPQAGDGRYNNQRPFRPNFKQVHENRRPYYNDYETNYNRKRDSEIGDFGNGHDNSNTFNIHKKNIYIS